MYYSKLVKKTNYGKLYILECISYIYSYIIIHIY